MALNKVEICGLDTSKLPKITQSESMELLSRIKAGDNAAREEFIGANLRLVLSIIQRFSGRGEQMDDLFQVGCIGLIKAIDNFDINLQVRFSTYAVPMIIGELRRYLRDNTALRVSRSIRDTAYKALKKRTELMDELSREPKLGEIAKALDMKKGTLPSHSKPYRIPFRYMNPYITTMAMHCSLWTKYGTIRMGTKSGWIQ